MLSSVKQPQRDAALKRKVWLAVFVLSVLFWVAVGGLTWYFWG